jgi:hypothetical protein
MSAVDLFSRRENPHETIRLGSSYVDKVCQLIQPGTKLTYAYLSVDKVAVTMTLRVYDV